LGAGPVQGPWWSLKVEYLYVDFGRKDYLFDNFVDRSVDLRDQIVRAGLNLHF
jgi:opacity protein-like surface antigen